MFLNLPNRLYLGSASGSASASLRELPQVWILDFRPDSYTGDSKGRPWRLSCAAGGAAVDAEPCLPGPPCPALVLCDLGAAAHLGCVLSFR